MLSKIFALWRNILSAVKATLSGNAIDEIKRQAEIFEDTNDVNYTAIASYNVATLATSECSVDITGESDRAQKLDTIANNLQDELSGIVYMTLGEGGAVLIPQLLDNEITLTYVSQKQFMPIKWQGKKLLEADVIIDYAKEKNETYFLIARYILDKITARIDYRTVSQDGKEKTMLLRWQDKIPLVYNNVKQLPIVYIKSPRKGRKGEKMGIGITYGCESTLESLKLTRQQINEEIDSARRILFVDELMLAQKKRKIKDKDGKERFESYGNFKITERIFPMRTSREGSGKAIEDYSPLIRITERIQNEERLKKLLESEMGLSAGIISELETRYVNVDEIRQQNSKTIAFINDIHKTLEQAIKEYLNIADMLITAHGIAPLGDWDYNIDWFDPFESSTTQFERLLTAYDKNEIKPGEIRKWLYPNLTEEQIQEDMKEIASLQPTARSLLSGMQADNPFEVM